MSARLGDTPIARCALNFPAMRAMLNDMAYCELCDMNREFCEHGLVERHRNATTIARELLISPMGMAHFPGCPHKGDDPDYSRWAQLDAPRAWQRLGNGAAASDRWGMSQWR